MADAMYGAGFLRTRRQRAACLQASCPLRPFLLLGCLGILLGVTWAFSLAPPFKAGQEAKAIQALMSAARQLELGFEGVTMNSTAVCEFLSG